MAEFLEPRRGAPPLSLTKEAPILANPEEFQAAKAKLYAALEYLLRGGDGKNQDEKKKSWGRGLANLDACVLTRRPFAQLGNAPITFELLEPVIDEFRQLCDFPIRPPRLEETDTVPAELQALFNRVCTETEQELPSRRSPWSYMYAVADAFVVRVVASKGWATGSSRRGSIIDGYHWLWSAGDLWKAASSGMDFPG